jgi:hypothetical protein
MDYIEKIEYMGNEVDKEEITKVLIDLATTQFT